MGGFIKSFFRCHRRSTRSSSALASPSVTGSSSSSRHIEELERVFRKFDSNGDGKISASELAATIEALGHPASPEDIARMMAEADTDGDGAISLEEFVDVNTRDVDGDASVEDLQYAFSVFDADRSGTISAEEIASVLRSLGDPTTVAQCREMIRGVDLDGDGFVDFEEFKTMMTTTSSIPVRQPCMIDGEN